MHRYLGLLEEADQFLFLQVFKDHIRQETKLLLHLLIHIFTNKYHFKARQSFFLFITLSNSFSMIPEKHGQLVVFSHTRKTDFPEELRLDFTCLGLAYGLFGFDGQLIVSQDEVHVLGSYGDVRIALKYGQYTCIREKQAIVKQTILLSELILLFRFLLVGHQGQFLVPSYYVVHSSTSHRMQS